MQDEKIQLRFDPGKFYITTGAAAALQRNETDGALQIMRHLRCDWGDVCVDDSDMNDEALENGSRILSSYDLQDGTKIWIITEAVGADGARGGTTILLPEEY